MKALTLIITTIYYCHTCLKLVQARSELELGQFRIGQDSDLGVDLTCTSWCCDFPFEN